MIEIKNTKLWLYGDYNVDTTYLNEIRQGPCISSFSNHKQDQFKFYFYNKDIIDGEEIVIIYEK